MTLPDLPSSASSSDSSASLSDSNASISDDLTSDLAEAAGAAAGASAAAESSASTDAVPLTPSTAQLKAVVAELVREVLAEQFAGQLQGLREAEADEPGLSFEEHQHQVDELRQIARESARLPVISSLTDAPSMRRVSPFGLWIQLDPDALETGLIHMLEKIWKDADERTRQLTVIDCKDLQRMSSASLGTLILFSDTVAASDGAMVLVNVRRSLAITLEMMGLQDELPFFENVAAFTTAIRGFGKHNKLV